MKFKKIISIFLIVVMLCSFASCGKSSRHVYPVLKDVFDNNTFNTVANITFTSVLKETQETEKYQIYIDADSDINRDIGQLYAKYSTNDSPFEYLCRYSRNGKNLYYNLDDYIKYCAVSAGKTMNSTEAFKNNMDLNYEYAVADTTKMFFNTIENEHGGNVLPNLFMIFDFLGKNFFDFLIENEIAIINDNTSFTEITITEKSLITIFDYLATQYNDIRKTLVKEIKKSENEYMKTEIEDSYVALFTFDALSNTWKNFSEKEKEVFLNEYFSDFNLTMVFDTYTPNMVSINVLGSFSKNEQDIRFEGIVRFQKIESFEIPTIETYAGYDTNTIVKAAFCS